MSKKTGKTANKPKTKAEETVPGTPETPPEAAKVPLPAEIVTPDPVPESPPETEKTPKRYVFPRQGDIECPKCGLYETVATSSPQGPIQWRKCTRAIPVCRHTFKITGTEVKITDCKQDT